MNLRVIVDMSMIFNMNVKYDKNSSSCNVVMSKLKYIE